MMHAGHILFCRISIERLGVRMDRVKRAHGMELLVGNPTLANIMGQDENLAEVLDCQKDLLVCGKCLEEHPVLYLLLLPEKGPIEG
jgi:hypothetical protein